MPCPRFNKACLSGCSCSYPLFTHWGAGQKISIRVPEKPVFIKHLPGPNLRSFPHPVLRQQVLPAFHARGGKKTIAWDVLERLSAMRSH